MEHHAIPFTSAPHVSLRQDLARRMAAWQQDVEAFERRVEADNMFVWRHIHLLCRAVILATVYLPVVSLT